MSAPYTWTDIEEQLRRAIWAQASQIYEFGPQDQGAALSAFLGFDAADWDAEAAYSDWPTDLDRHAITHHARVAYDYAYQTRFVDAEQAESSWHDVDGLLKGYAQSDANGEPSPLHPAGNAPLRRMLEAFFARFALFERGWDMTIHQLALLANMAVPTTRTSLSKEGIKLDKRSRALEDGSEETVHVLDAEQALHWLSQRRGFIPQITIDAQADVARAEERVIQALFVPMAADGTMFTPDLARKGHFSIGPKGAEIKVEGYEEALRQLQAMEVARWRRPNQQGNWGIVVATEWRRMERAQLD